MEVLFTEIGPVVFRRMYRMEEITFKRLLSILEPLFNLRKRKRGMTPNGEVTAMARLSMAIRWAAGGDKFDIAALHGVSPYEVHKSLWLVVDAIHGARKLDISFPKLDEQETVAAGFMSKSKAGFSNCVGAIDCMLVWTSKPTEKLDELKVGPIWLDCSLRQRIEDGGAIRDGFVLFGDNAYINTPYLVAPFKNVKSGSKDFVEPEHRNMRRSRDRYMRDLPIFKMLQWIEQQGFTRPPIEDYLALVCVYVWFHLDLESGDCKVPLPMKQLSLQFP
eukprot:scaffold10461_cov115-Cylindrotheca_fusiformis.AAC.1